MTRLIRVTPDTVQDALDQAAPGDTIIFTPGRYTQSLHLDDKHGTAASPITLRSEPGAILTMNTGQPRDRFFEANRAWANMKAKEIEDAGKFPSLSHLMGEARLTITNADHIHIEGLHFEQAWPTMICLTDVRDIAINNADFKDATYAIAARGETTERITITNTTWQQDPTGQMWKNILWKSIHGDNVAMNDDGKSSNDYRLYDGNFFYANAIKGDVTIKNCTVTDAFNAIRFTRPTERADLNNDLTVEHCNFERIRDNILEPEQGASRWSFIRNTITDAHKPIALEAKPSGKYQDFLIANNRFDMFSVPGPENEEYTGRTIFKIDNANTTKAVSILFRDNDINPSTIVLDKHNYLGDIKIEGTTHSSAADRIILSPESDTPAIPGDLPSPPKKFTDRIPEPTR